ncbi:MAG: hypothetical protein U0167_15185 [bacterium]
MKPRWMVLTGAAVLLATTAWSEERTVPVRDVAVVQDGHGAARVFFRLGAISISQSTLIDRAVLTVPFTGDLADRAIELRVSPVTQAWAGNPSFDTPYDDSLSGRCEVDLRRGSGVANFDLTVALKESLEEGVFSDGFVLTARSEGATATDLARFGTLSGATLRLTTTTLPSGKPPWAMRGRNPQRPARHPVGSATGRTR